MQIHQKQLKGQSFSEIEDSILKLACLLDTYGVDPHPVKVNNFWLNDFYRIFTETFMISINMSKD